MCPPVPTAGAVRRAAGAAARCTGSASTATLVLPATTRELVRAVVRGWELGGYSFDAYRSRRTERATYVTIVTSAAADERFQAAALEGAQVAQAQNLARIWVNTPPGNLTPDRFAQSVIELSKRRSGHPVQLRLLAGLDLVEGGYGGILGVGRASTTPPLLLELHYQPADAERQIAFVGEGITYDSGGLSIKAADLVATMKTDMAGAAAAIAAVLAAADLGLPIGISAHAPLAENMIAGDALRPGDVLRMYDRQTVEVTSTDAEGRDAWCSPTPWPRHTSSTLTPSSTWQRSPGPASPRSARTSTPPSRRTPPTQLRTGNAPRHGDLAQPRRRRPPAERRHEHRCRAPPQRARRPPTPRTPRPRVITKRTSAVCAESPGLCSATKRTDDIRSHEHRKGHHFGIA
nr:M17 family peptidase N-terminal domain-containing protein [Streptacidiphilus jiangxiensis]